VRYPPRAPGARRMLAVLLGVALVAVAVAGCGGHQSPQNLRARRESATPVPDPAAGASHPASTYGLTAAQLAAIPRFPPAPVPQPVAVPAGPLAGWFSAIPTHQRVAFITIDDGWIKSPKALPLLEAAHVPVTLFLEINAIRSNVGYFAPMRQAGAVIEAHTITHIELKGKPYALQKHEICGSADRLKGFYGRRPVLFRPPFGDKDTTTLRAVHDCGMKAAFFWKETTDKGVVRYQVGHTVQPGDIILMHFRPAFVKDFLAVLRAIARAGLTPARLESYVA
jgi:peptidoglycan/xylan/chitin deacetylase (PgdA/CDA1 family)